MSVRVRINTLREEAGRALTASREFGLKIADPANVAQVATLTESFNKAKADFDAKLVEIQMLERIDEVEKLHSGWTTPAATVPHAGGGDVPDPKAAEKIAAVHRKGFLAFMRYGESFAMDVLRHGGVPAEMLASVWRAPDPSKVSAEGFALLSTAGDLGGFLVPDDFRAEVIKDLAGFAVIRGLARVERTGSSALVFPTIKSATVNPNIYSSGYVGAWKGEGYVTGGTAPPVQNQPTFGQARVPVHVWQPDAVEVTVQLLEDSAADLDGILAETIAETKGLDEDAAFLNGNGVGKPEGIMTAALAEVVSGDANLLTYNGLVDVFANLPAQYRQNARWLMNSLTYGAILKLKDSQNRPILTPNEMPGLLWGKPIAYSEFMPNIAAGTFPIVFGDFRYYVIADRQELRIQRLTERFAPNVGLLPTSRTGGQVVRTAAFKKQKISA